MLLPKIFPVTCHTDHVGPGSTFVAIKGFANDGTAYISQALAQGATTIVVQDDCHHGKLEALCKQHNATYVRVPDARKDLAQRAAQALGNPAQKLKIIGVTGTKGKTSTTFLVEHILRTADYKTALMSSVMNKIGDQHEDSLRATQQSDYIQMFFAECVKRGVQYVALEVSSHALALDRIYGIQFDAVGFNNLKTDHLDFHETMENYFATKMQLLSMIKPQGALVINTDNEWGGKAFEYASGARFLRQAQDERSNGSRRACGPPHHERESNSAHPEERAFEAKRLEGHPLPHIYTFGTEPFENERHITMDIERATCDGIEMLLHMRPGLTLECPQLFGTFNCYNIAMASIICAYLGINYSTIARAVASFKGTPGRLQRHVLKNGALAFIDYAHMPFAMQEVLQTLRPFTQHLIVVFGCGGNKDKTRRPAMGKIAAELGDVVIVTDDNPRFEEPQDIANDILAGIPAEQKHKVTVMLNRHDAIAHAAKIAKPDSIIALLGKGHENYYVVKDQTFHFNDLEEIGKF